MKPEVLEWLYQAEYEFEDAECLILGQRYPKAVFCSHLAVENGLKALYLHHFNNQPPRTHNLDFLIQAIPGGIPGQFEELINLLEDISVKIRYPPVLDILLSEITADNAK